MHITCHAHREFPASAEQAFALSIDSVRFPHWFRGYGPIAAIERIESNGAPRVGGQRTVYNADGSMPCRIATSRARRRSSRTGRSEEHTSELQSLMRISYSV